eukprot:8642091-Pyramimonas_sp.AAC.1
MTSLHSRPKGGHVRPNVTPAALHRPFAGFRRWLRRCSMLPPASAGPPQKARRAEGEALFWRA